MNSQSLTTLRRSYALRTAQWLELSQRYLPVTLDNSIWRYSRHALPDDPSQGWKLHIAATVLSAVRVFRAVAPLLSDLNLLFKAPISLDELAKLNSGILYDYSQVGKLFTVYPQTTEEAVWLAGELHKLTLGLDCPDVPFDFKYGAGSCVYYRYGAFKPMELEVANGNRIKALRDASGKLVPDKRDCRAIPDWVVNPFPVYSSTSTTPATHLQTFRAFRAFTQRGRGGVFHAVDVSVDPPRLCVLKQGRRNGDTGWDGRDGVWRVKNEKRVLLSLRENGIPVPRVYTCFKLEKNYFLVLEFIEGETLDRWLSRRRRRLSLARALQRSADVARLLALMHESGWVWRDCKPGNLIISPNGELRPLDFEGACRINRPDPLPWGTQGFTAPETRVPFHGQSQTAEDLYSLGVIIYFLLAGRLPDQPFAIPLNRMRRNVPTAITQLVSQLLDRNPAQRPGARTAELRINSVLSLLTSAAVKSAA